MLQKMAKDVTTALINARFTALDSTSGEWLCDCPAAQSLRIKAALAGIGDIVPQRLESARRAPTLGSNSRRRSNVWLQAGVTALQNDRSSDDSSHWTPL